MNKLRLKGKRDDVLWSRYWQSEDKDLHQILLKAFGLRREGLVAETHPIPSDRLVQSVQFF